MTSVQWIPRGAPAVPASTPGPAPQSYGGEDVTLVPGRLRGYRSWRGCLAGRWPAGLPPHRSEPQPPRGRGGGVDDVRQPGGALSGPPASSPTRVTETRMVERTCERAAVAYRELWHALARKYQVPIFRQWRDLVAAYPPTDLAALCR